MMVLQRLPGGLETMLNSANCTRCEIRRSTFHADEPGAASRFVHAASDDRHCSSAPRGCQRQ